MYTLFNFTKMLRENQKQINRNNHHLLFILFFCFLSKAPRTIFLLYYCCFHAAIMMLSIQLDVAVNIIYKFIVLKSHIYCKKKTFQFCFWYSRNNRHGNKIWKKYFFYFFYQMFKIFFRAKWKFEFCSFIYSI